MAAAIDNGYSMFMVSCDTQVFNSAITGIVADARKAVEQSAAGRSLRAVKHAAVS
jgi:hypothetical protein